MSPSLICFCLRLSALLVSSQLPAALSSSHHQLRAFNFSFCYIIIAFSSPALFTPGYEKEEKKGGFFFFHTFFFNVFFCYI